MMMKNVNIYRCLLLAMGGLLLQLATPVLIADECKGGYSQQLKISGEVDNRLQIGLADLQDYSPMNLTTTVYSGSAGLVTRTYRGVALLDVLDTAGIRTNAAVKNAIIRKTVTIRATDCYQTVLSIADLMPEFAGRQVLVAYEVDGELLGEDGFAKLVIADDKKAGRYVANISRITVQ